MSNFGGNIFLDQSKGPGGTNFLTPTSLIGPQGYDPAIGQIARSYSQNAFNTVSSYLGGKNMLSSSAYPVMLEQAFRGAHTKAFQDASQQQDMFARWAMAQNQLAAQVPPEQESGNIFQNVLGGAAQGALVGGSFGGPGAAWGAGLGGLAGLFGGNQFF